MLTKSSMTRMKERLYDFETSMAWLQGLLDLQNVLTYTTTEPYT